MARLPSKTLVASRDAGVMMPQGAFGDSTQAITNLARSVGASANTIIQMGFDAQDIKNKAQVREKLSELRNIKAQFDNDVMEQNMEPGLWVTEWQKRLSQFENTVGGKDVPPVVKDAVSQKFSEFADMSLLQIGGEAIKENRRNAGKIYDNDVNYFLSQQDYDSARQTTAEAYENNIIDDTQYELANKAIDRTRDETERNADLELDPVGYAQNVKDGKYGFSEVRKIEELRKAEKQRTRKEHESITDVQDMVEAGMISNVDELTAQLNEYPEVDDVTKKKFIKAYSTSSFANALSYQERYDLTDRMNDNFKKFQSGDMSPEEYTIEHNKLKTEIALLGKRAGASPLNERMYRTDPSHFINKEQGANPERLKDAESDLKEAVRNRASGAYNVRITKAEEAGLGDVDMDKLKTREKDNQLSFRSEMEREMLDWARSRSEYPTVEEVLAHMDKVQPAVAERVLKQRKAAKSAADDMSGAKRAIPVGTSDRQREIQERVQKIKEFSNTNYDFMVLPPKQ